MFQSRNVGGDENNAAVVRPPLADLDPFAAGTVLEVGSLRMVVQVEAFLHPGFDISDRSGDITPFSSTANDRFERVAELHAGAQAGHHFAVLAVTDDETIVPVKQRKPLRHTLDGF